MLLDIFQQHRFNCVEVISLPGRPYCTYYKPHASSVGPLNSAQYDLCSRIYCKPVTYDPGYPKNPDWIEYDPAKTQKTRAAQQEWSDGKTGLAGVSYLAWAQWMAASLLGDTNRKHPVAPAGISRTRSCKTHNNPLPSAKQPQLNRINQLPPAIRYQYHIVDIASGHQRSPQSSTCPRP